MADTAYVDPRTRPFRFGISTGGADAWTRQSWTEHARRVESLGFATLQVSDHFNTATVCTPLLAAAAVVTTTLRVGSNVYSNDFRHPLLLAREAAEIDVLSDGRMELGIGAGWLRDEYLMAGIAFDEGPVRAERFEEAVGLVRRLHLGETVSHQGRHYALDEAALGIEPVQRPIPLLLAAGGPRTTRFAARMGDIAGFVPRSLPGGGLDPSSFATGAFEARLAILESAVDRADGGPERAVLVFHVVRSADELPADGSAGDPAALVDSPHALVGDTVRIVDALVERRERYGVSCVTCFGSHLEAMAPVVARLAGR